MKKKAVIYARFSSHGQTDQSIEGQLRECYSFAERNDYVVIKEYIDKALTGTTDKRPQFLQMIADSKKKNFDYVLVYQLDRFARNRYDSANYKQKLKKNDVRVLSAKENISDDASGILMEGMLESMAEYYSVELGQKVKRGIKESLLKGNFIGGHVLYGYEIKDKKWQVNEPEAEVVRKIFNYYYDGKKTKDIAEWLSNSAIKTKKQKDWTMNAISKTIRNTKYKGLVVVDDIEYENVVPAIIEKRIFDRCNDLMDKHKHKTRHSESNHHYILSGKLFCGNCYGSMTAETGTSKTGKVHTYYKCYNKKKKLKNCKKKNISKEEIEEFVIEQTKECVLQPKMVDHIARIITDKFNSEISEGLVVENLERQIVELNKNIEGMLNAIQMGIVTNSTKERLIDLEKEREDLQEKLLLEKAHQLKPMDYYEIRKHLLFFANKDYDNQSARNNFFNTFIKKVILSDDKVLIIYSATLDDDFNDNDLLEIENENEKDKVVIFKKTIEKESESNKKISSKLLKFKRDALGGTQAHTLGTVINFYPKQEVTAGNTIKNNNANIISTSQNQFNQGLKRKHSLKIKYEQEKKLTYTKIAQTKQSTKQSKIITAQFNPKHLLLVVGIDR